jgi:hypothetical protein
MLGGRLNQVMGLASTFLNSLGLVIFSKWFDV